MLVPRPLRRSIEGMALDPSRNFLDLYLIIHVQCGLLGWGV